MNEPRFRYTDRSFFSSMAHTRNFSRDVINLLDDYRLRDFLGISVERFEISPQRNTDRIITNNKYNDNSPVLSRSNAVRPRRFSNLVQHDSSFPRFDDRSRNAHENCKGFSFFSCHTLYTKTKCNCQWAVCAAHLYRSY